MVFVRLTYVRPLSPYGKMEFFTFFVGKFCISGI